MPKACPPENLLVPESEPLPKNGPAKGVLAKENELANIVEVRESKEIFSGRVFRLVREEIRFGEGKTAVRDIIKHPGAVVFIPQESDGRLLILKQYRQALRETILEFPAGTLERDEPPLECAKRELAEEAGKAAEEWHELGLLYPSPGLCDEIQHCYLCRRLSSAFAKGDEDEMIEIESLTVAEVEKAISSGDLRDGKSIAIFTRARLAGLI